MAKITFDVYILHSYPYVFQYLMKDSFRWIAQLNPCIMVLVVLISSVSIFLVCIPVAYLKYILFRQRSIKCAFD